MMFAELVPGRVIETRSRRLDQDEILEFARRYDSQWFHVDPERAARGRWKGLIASGWQTCAIAMELAVSEILAGSESFGSPGIDQLRWLGPVRPGDMLRLQISVLESRISQSGGTGSVLWRWSVLNQHDATVLELVATSLFDLRNPVA